MTAYYNEFDPFAAQWLRNLIDANAIAPGEVDERSITEVTANDVMGFTQHHYFAGIGGWSLALRLAGWPDDRAVTTGSAPCQPFSAAGKQKGEADELHLWPEFRRLIADCKPATIFGEQVASRLGREWLAGVRADLEALGYAVGAADLCAASVGAPQIRQRLWWVANAESARYSRSEHAGALGEETGERPRMLGIGGHGATGRLAGGDSKRLPRRSESNSFAIEPEECASRWRDAGGCCHVVPLTDGTFRRVEPGSFPMAPRIPANLGQTFPELRSVAKSARSNRVGRLRGYGNAIVPQVAATFIRAFMEATAPQPPGQRHEEGSL